MKSLFNAGLFAFLHVAASMSHGGGTCTPEKQPAPGKIFDSSCISEACTKACGAQDFPSLSTAAPTKAPTTPAPTTPKPTTTAPTTPAPTTPAPTTTAPPPTPPPPTPPPPTTQGPTTCARQLCLAPTTVSVTTTNTTVFSSTTTNTTLPGPATHAPTMTTTNTTTLTTVTTTNTTTSSIPSTTTTNSTLGSSTSTNTSTTTTSVTTETTTNYTTTTTNTTLSGNSWTVVTMTTTNTTTLTTVTTTNTTIGTHAPTQTTTNVTTTVKLTTVTTRDPCACYTTTAASGGRRLQPTKMPRRLQATGCNMSCAGITNMGFASDHPCASPIKANKTAKCDIMEANALFAACLPSFTLKCPDNNDMDTTKAFVHEQGKPLKCKVCGAVVAGADADTATKGKYKTSLTFGNNLHSNDGEGGFKELMITGYAIHIVDVNYKVVEDTGVTVKIQGSFTCCKPSQYTAFLHGNWPTDGAMFAVVPYLKLSSTSTVMLPVGTGYSAAFTDVGDIPIKKVKQSFSLKGMSKAGCDELKNDPNCDDILASAVAEAASKNVDGLTKDMFVVLSKTCTLTVTTRRLEAVQRRLATDHQMDFETEASIPATVTYDADTVAGADLVEAVKTQAKKKSNIVAEIASAEVAAPVVGEVIGTEPPVTGAAHRFAGSLLSSIVVLITVLTGPRFIA